MYFTQEHELFRNSLREFLDREVVPNIDLWEEQQQIPREIWKKMGNMGFLGLSMPEQYGGLNLDFMYEVIFLEETNKCYSGGFGISQTVVQFMSAPYLLKYGSDYLKQKYLPGILSGNIITAIGITEPDAGSDVMNIKTHAKREGNHYIINGSKTFITNSYYGDFVVLVTKTGEKLDKFSLLFVDLKSEGVSKRKINKLGWRSSDTGELHFDNVKVPVDHLIGEEGMGFYYLMNGLQLERIASTVLAYSVSEEALHYTINYIKEREAFGKKLSNIQVLRHKIATLAAEVESSKQFSLYICKRHSMGDYLVKECSMAKMVTTEITNKVMTECLQCFGGYGFNEDFKIARMFRDARVGTIGAGTSEIMREIIAKMIIDDVDYKKK
jgi:acyl-CoA dehydrogenase